MLLLLPVWVMGKASPSGYTRILSSLHASLSSPPPAPSKIEGGMFSFLTSLDEGIQKLGSCLTFSLPSLGVKHRLETAWPFPASAGSSSLSPCRCLQPGLVLVFVPSCHKNCSYMLPFQLGPQHHYMLAGQTARQALPCLPLCCSLHYCLVPSSQAWTLSTKVQGISMTSWHHLDQLGVSSTASRGGVTLGRGSFGTGAFLADV